MKVDGKQIASKIFEDLKKRVEILHEYFKVDTSIL